jgi:sugar transferase (PEP-CTERM/EpsH1 system associated)
MAIRILHVVNSLGSGGLENGLVNLAGCLPEFEHVVVATRSLGPNAARLERLGARVECLNFPDEGRFGTPAIASVIRRFAPGVVHSRNWGAIEAVFAGRWAGGCGLVHSEHGMEAGAEAPQPCRRRWLRRMAFEAADRVVAVSRQLGEFHARRTGFPEARIEVIHNGVDCRRFRAGEDARRCMRRELGLDDDAFCVGCVANLLPVKDHMTLLRAFAAHAAGPGRRRLLLAGEGPERERVEAFVRSHHECTGRVCFLGSTTRVAELLNALDVFVLPSLNEGISNALLEAMASGVPVVATAAGGNPEVVETGVSGMLFPPGDHAALGECLHLLEGRPDLRLRLGRGAARRVREAFSLEAMASSWRGVYEETARGSREPARARAVG